MPMNRIPIQDTTDHDTDPEVVPLYASRRKIHPRVAPGLYRNIRLLVSTLFLLAYFLTPWLLMDGRQAVLFDLPARQFHVFWFSFVPQDFILLSGLLVFAAFALFFVTTLWGRVWCGYTCPQTVWSFLFIWVERQLEGSPQQRVRWDNTPTPLKREGRNLKGLEKLARRLGKHCLWLLIALATGATFIAYFYGARELVTDALAWQIPLVGVAWIIFFTLATYINAGWLREHVCIYICPYARFQSVMYDADTLAVSYDPNRGEPRTSARKRAATGEGGDCIDCTLCVQVCPTGIDIRDGLQYECIGCAACIDACDTVMDKVGYPRGLIRYSTENELAGQPRTSRRPKAFLYGIAALLALVLLSTTLWQREPLRVEVARDRGALYQEVSGGRIENSYQLRLQNVSNQDHELRVSVSGLPEVELLPDNMVHLPVGELLDIALRVQVPAGALEQSNTDIEFIIQSPDDTLHIVRESRFIGPRN